MKDQIENLKEKMKNYQAKSANVSEDHMTQLEKMQEKLQATQLREQQIRKQFDEYVQSMKKKLMEQEQSQEPVIEHYKKKFLDLEDKFKLSDSRRTSIMFEHEKERARWQLEKNHLQLQKDDLVQIGERLQQKRD